MTININEVQEIIKNLDSGGELSIKEEKYLKIAKLCVQLAAENAALKSAVDHTIEWIESTNGDPCDVVILKGIRTPATDRIVAGIKADGVEEFSSYISLYNSNAERHAIDFAKQLREGVNHD